MSQRGTCQVSHKTNQINLIQFLIELPMEPRSKKQTSRASIQRSIETQRMSLQIGMKTVDLNSSIHTERQLMLGNQVIHCCQVVQLVFPLIDQLQLFT